MESQFKIQPLKLETMCDLDDGIFKAALDQALESAGNDLVRPARSEGCPQGIG